MFVVCIKNMKLELLLCFDCSVFWQASLLALPSANTSSDQRCHERLFTGRFEFQVIKSGSGILQPVTT